MEHGGLVGILFPFVVFGGPLALGLLGLLRERGGVAARPAWDWRLSLRSGLFHLLAFNLTVFVQELFLVVPKALTPGLEPVGKGPGLGPVLGPGELLGDRGVEAHFPKAAPDPGVELVGDLGTIEYWFVSRDEGVRYDAYRPDRPHGLRRR